MQAPRQEFPWAGGGGLGRGGGKGWVGIGGIGYGIGLSEWEQNAMADPIELEMRTVDDDNRNGDKLGGEEWKVR
jgi:hypothetical protein